MKLYNADLSPYAARVRLAIYRKDLKIEIVAPPESGLKGPEYLALNPMGKIPVLVTENGETLPESETILEYLEDIFPTPSLRPAGPMDRARARLVARIGDIYVQTTIFPLFSQLNPAARDTTIVETQLASLEKGLTHLDHYLSGGSWAVGTQASLADCSLQPVLFWVNFIAQTFGKPDLITAHPKVSAYWTASNADPICAKVLAEMQAGLVAMMARRQAQ
jgi:glutathione S-transferase